MNTKEGKILLPIARAAISRALDVPYSADETAPWLAEHGACFVTLTQNGELRGCIGTLQAHRPLLSDVKSNAVSAAMHDPRFMPLSADELDITTVEVSLLSPTTVMDVRDEADALAQMRPNVDGIVFEYSPPDTLLAEPAACGRGSLAAIPAPKGYAPPSHGPHTYRSTFLPQVWEDLAQPREFLAMLRRKAGLPDDFWEEGVKLSRYTVTKWSEKH
ncbi:MAG TPA: AmmeMemoRadiSam system protein A [Gallionella sp.]|nr:AmmeMemoRadiSam system protein A [Gallionella sp.]